MALNVLGTGLGRTGTMSLKMALEQLEGQPCMHMVELLIQSLSSKKRLNSIKQAHKTGTTDWDAVFEGYSTCVDYPMCLFYKDIMRQYPNVKIVHTVRDPEAWHQSVLDTIYRGKPKSVRDILRLLKNMIFHSDVRKLAPVFMFSDKLIWSGQFKSKFKDKAFAIELFHKHTEEVQKHVPKDNLLIFEVKEGWKSLCNFLGKPIPSEPFPRANSKEVFNKKMDKFLYQGVFEA